MATKQERIAEALGILKDFGLPQAQLNDRTALTLLALLGLKADQDWTGAGSELIGITPIMAFAKAHYGREYAPNTRETFRRFSMHQLVEAGLALSNPNEPDRPTNSPKTVYRIEPSALALLRKFRTDAWEEGLEEFLASTQTLRTRYASEREMRRIPLRVSEGRTITLTPGGQNVLVERIVTEFAEIFAPGATPIYVGDTGDKYAYFDRDALSALGVTVPTHGKMPDVVIHDTERDWLLLIEAVTSHGPVDAKRKAELTTLFGASSAGLVFVTTFLTRKAMLEYLPVVAWETEVWVAESPTHMIHFNGSRFLGPYPDRKAS